MNTEERKQLYFASFITAAISFAFLFYEKLTVAQSLFEILYQYLNYLIMVVITMVFGMMVYNFFWTTLANCFQNKKIGVAVGIIAVLILPLAISIVMRLR